MEYVEGSIYNADDRINAPWEWSAKLYTANLDYQPMNCFKRIKQNIFNAWTLKYLKAPTFTNYITRVTFAYNKVFRRQTILHKFQPFSKKGVSHCVDVRCRKQRDCKFRNLITTSVHVLLLPRKQAVPVSDFLGVDYSSGSSCDN